MKVTLLNHTPKPLKTMYIAARTCYSESGPSTIQNELPSEEKMERLIRKIFDSGHWTIGEHIYFTFAVEGISRSCSHQFVRHRLATFSQKSQRYVDSKDFAYVTPKTIKYFETSITISDTKFQLSYPDLMKILADFYQKATEKGVPKEDARFVLPNATKTDLVVSFDFRELTHIYDLRACNRAQWEIQQVAKSMKKEVGKKFPFLASFLKIRCEKLGYCPDLKTCGRYPLKKDVE